MAPQRPPQRPQFRCFPSSSPPSPSPVLPFPPRALALPPTCCSIPSIHFSFSFLFLFGLPAVFLLLILSSPIFFFCSPLQIPICANCEVVNPLDGTTHDTLHPSNQLAPTRLKQSQLDSNTHHSNTRNILAFACACLKLLALKQIARRKLGLRPILTHTNC